MVKPSRSCTDGLLGYRLQAVAAVSGELLNLRARTHRSWSYRLSGLGQALAYGEPGQLDAVVDVELAHEAGTVSIHRADTDVHEGGDLLLGKPLGDIGQHFQFPRRQRRYAGRLRLHQSYGSGVHDDP